MLYQQIKNYVESLSSHKDLKKAVFGSMDLLLSGMGRYKSEEDYPLLFVPEFVRSTKTTDGEHRYTTISLLPSIFKPWHKNEGENKRQEILNELEPLIHQIGGRFYEDFELRIAPFDKAFFEIEGDGPNIAEPIGSSRLVGWTYEFELSLQSELIHTPENWN